MKQPQIFGHGPYVGTTGYNNHTRDFFRGISKYFPLKFRNFTVGKSWEGMSDEPEVPDEPELPEVPEEPDDPLVPDEPDEPELPELPDVPEEPDDPLVPDEPDEPELPELPDVPEEPDDPLVPLEPDEPSKPIGVIAIKISSPLYPGFGDQLPLSM